MNKKLENHEIMIVVISNVNKIFNGIVNMLKAFGYVLHHSTDEAVDLKIIIAKSADIIIIDGSFQRYSPFLLAEELLARSSKKPELIFTYPSDRLEDKMKAFALGVSEYFTFPFYAEEIFVKTRQLAEKIKEKNKLLAENQALKHPSTLTTVPLPATETLKHFDDYFHGQLPLKKLFLLMAQEAIYFCQKDEKVIIILIKNLTQTCDKSLIQLRWLFGNQVFAGCYSDDIIAIGFKRSLPIKSCIDEIHQVIENYKLIYKDILHLAVTFYPDDRDNLEDLLQCAEKSLDKLQGKTETNYQLCSYQDSSYAFQHVLFQENVKEALLQEEMSVYGQPIFDLTSEKVSGIEILIRWQHPKLGLLTPGQFLPLAQASGMMAPLGHWLFDQLLQQLSHWHHQGIPIPWISININYQQLTEEGFFSKIEAAINHYFIDKKLISLEIELNEETMMQLNNDMCRQMAALGFSLAVDDFGTGVSSLKVLNEFPVKRIKIDAKFIQAIEYSEKTCRLIQGIVNLARTLGIAVVAEGVETLAQKQFLQKIHCQQAQGFFWCVPKPLAEISAWLTEK